MKFFSAILLLLCSLSANAQIEWLSWEEAIARNEEQPRKLLVDVYTDWCGWCKKMDKTSFQDAEVVRYISENYYAVKLDAEQRESIRFDNHEFTYDPSIGRRGAHSLAVALLDGRMSFPSIVYLDHEQKRITISPGFKQAEQLLQELTYVGDDHFRSRSFQEYLDDAPGK